MIKVPDFGVGLPDGVLVCLTGLGLENFDMFHCRLYIVHHLVLFWPFSFFWPLGVFPHISVCCTKNNLTVLGT
jgi:hypothetical protein